MEAGLGGRRPGRCTHARSPRREGQCEQALEARSDVPAGCMLILDEEERVDGEGEEEEGGDEENGEEEGVEKEQRVGEGEAEEGGDEEEKKEEGEETRVKDAGLRAFNNPHAST